MQKLFQHQSANRISSSSTTPFAPPQPSVSFQSSMHTFTPCAFPQPFPLFQTSMHFSSSPSAPYQTSMHFSSSPSAPYQYSMHNIATPFPPPQSSMHSTAIPFPPPQQHAQLQSKCTSDPNRIIQSNCTTQLRHQSSSKTKEENDSHIRDTECFQECI